MIQYKATSDSVLYKYQKSKGSSKYYARVDRGDESVWIDTKALPNSAMLCAMCDGVTMIEVKIDKSTTRTFLPIDWCIEEWGSDKESIKALKEIREFNLKAYHEDEENDKEEGDLHE